MDRWHDWARLRRGDLFVAGPVALVVAAIAGLIVDGWL
jgi:hypothetical protein